MNQLLRLTESPDYWGPRFECEIIIFTGKLRCQILICTLTIILYRGLFSLSIIILLTVNIFLYLDAITKKSSKPTSHIYLLLNFTFQKHPCSFLFLRFPQSSAQRFLQAQLNGDSIIALKEGSHQAIWRKLKETPWTHLLWHNMIPHKESSNIFLGRNFKNIVLGLFG